MWPISSRIYRVLGLMHSIWPYSTQIFSSMKKTHKTILCGICSSFFCPVTEIVPSTLDLTILSRFFHLFFFYYCLYFFFTFVIRQRQQLLCISLYMCLLFLRPVGSCLISYLFNVACREREIEILRHGDGYPQK